jgi:hypothetical protein
VQCSLAAGSRKVTVPWRFQATARAWDLAGAACAVKAQWERNLANQVDRLTRPTTFLFGRQVFVCGAREAASGFRAEAAFRPDDSPKVEVLCSVQSLATADEALRDAKKLAIAWVLDHPRHAS